MGILLSRLVGLVRERVLAHFLGNELAAGALRAALRIPNLLQNLFGEGALSASFIPVYARLLAEGKGEAARRVAVHVFLLLLALVAALVVAGVFFSAQLVGILAPGFADEARELTVTLVRILFPGTGLLVLSAWCLGILNSHRQFFLSYVAPALWNVAIIAAVVAAAFAGKASGELAAAAAMGTLLGAVLQFGVQVPRTVRLLRTLGGAGPSGFAATADVLKNFGPALVARGVVQISAYIDQILSSYLGPTIVSAMAYAQTIYLLPISLFGMSVSAAELPEMAAATGDAETAQEVLRSRLKGALERVGFFVVPSAAVLIALGHGVAGVLLQSGRFSDGDAELVWLLLAASGLGLLANVQSRLLVSTLWALRDTVRPMRIAMIRVCLSAGLGAGAVFGLGPALGLPPAMSAVLLNLASAVVAWCEWLLLRRVVRVKLAGLPVIWPGLARAALAAALSAVVGQLVMLGLVASPPWLRGGAALFGFGVAYLGLAVVLGVGEAARFWARVRAKASLLRRRP